MFILQILLRKLNNSLMLVYLSISNKCQKENLTRHLGIHTTVKNLKNIKYNFTGHTRGYYYFIKQYVETGMVIMCPKSYCHKEY